jgi:glycosyltransferase involved in cell wall biosynthesis
VNDSQTGFLVPVRNPHKLAKRIVDILKDPALQQEMGQNAAKNAQAYAWSSIAKRLVRAFSGLVRR